MTPYFHHPADFRYDPRVMALRGEYGIEGYAWYFMIIEIMRGEKGYTLPLNPISVNRLTKELDMPVAKQVTDFIEFCCEIDLLVNRDDTISSPELDACMVKIDKVINQCRNAANIKHAKAKENAKR
jgi:hypothetical protein